MKLRARNSFYYRFVDLECVIGVALAILSAVTSAISVVLVRKVSNQSSTFNISLAISLVGMLVLWPLALILTDFSVVNIASILAVWVKRSLYPWICETIVLSGDEKAGSTNQLVPIFYLSCVHIVFGCSLFKRNFGTW